MSTPRRVIICGDSVFLTGVAESLRAMPGLEIVQVNARHPDAAARLAALQPDVIVVDQADAAVNTLLALLYQRPDLPVVGLDVSRNLLTILSAQEYPAADLSDLARVIQDL